MESRTQEQAESQKNNDELLEERKSDATSDETLSEVESSRSDIDSGNDNGGRAPSPDGTLDEAEETKEAGPM